MQLILFVDDDPGVRKGLERIVRADGLECRTESVESAEEALGRVGQGDVDVVVADVRMPHMDGIELLTRLKGNPATQHIPILMLTGDTDKTIKKVAIQLGAVDFIPKPADPDELVARLRNIMRLNSYQHQLLRQNDVLVDQLLQTQKMENAGVIAAGVAHDLNNSIGSILGHAEMALLQTPEERVYKALCRIVDACQHSAKLVRQLLQAGRRDKSAQSIVDLADLVNESLDLLGVTIPPTVEVEWNNPRLEARLLGDPTALCQIVMNLVINAVQAMKGAGKLKINLAEEHFDPAAKIGDSDTGLARYLRLEVADTGCGMTDEIQEKIFEPYFTTKADDGGTGLGLSVVSRVVSDHGGHMEVDSKPSVGTTFAVFLPVFATPGRNSNNSAVQSMGQ